MTNPATSSGGSEHVEDTSAVKRISKKSYLIGLIIIFAAVYSQYLIQGLTLVTDTLIVYGIPVLATGLLWGYPIIRRAVSHTFKALEFGLGFFGAFTLLGIVAASVIFSILATLDPSAVNLLNKPNPLLNIPPELAWIMVWFSFLVVGPAEEYLFRGFLYGGLLSLFKNRHWFSLAFVSSILFAAVHLYYVLVYEVASLVVFADVVTFGMAMAATYYLSGGNLLIPALIHGAYDATGFLSVAISLNVGVELRGFMILIGVVVAVVLVIRRSASKRPSF